MNTIMEREITVKNICSVLNNFTDLKSTLTTVIKYVKSLTGIEAVSIRLQDNGDYPYYVYNGFPETFIMKENSLCSRDGNGNRILADDKESYLLDCMCGNVIRKTFNPDLDFFTEKGSFWSNNTSSLLDSTTEEDRQGRTRNYCNSCGYESVALIPIKVNEQNIGLIQLNDKRMNMFTKELIEFLEMIGEQIGLAVNNAYSYTKLLESEKKLRVSNRELESFAFNVSHDLKKPLSNIVSGFKLIKMKHTSENDEEEKLIINEMTRQIEEMALMIDSLLEYSRINKHNGNLTLVDTEDVINSSINNLKTDIDKTRAKIIYDKLPKVYGDRILLIRLFQNLISNSVKYCMERIPEICITAKNKELHWLFSVKDNGIGINKDETAKIFQMLYRTKETKNNYEGTGIGLSTCKKIIEIHNGDIWVESELGRGSVFNFTIPK